MKKLLTLVALGSASLLAADSYQPQGNSNSWNQSQTQTDRGQQWNDPQGNSQQWKDPQGSNPQGSDLQGNDQQRYTGTGLKNPPDQKDDNLKSTSDQEITKKIHDTLSPGWVSKGFKDVTYDVNNGYVDLKGTVDTPENKKKVEDDVRKIKGVRDLNSLIIVVKPKPAPYTDAQLQTSEKKYPKDTAATRDDRQLNARIREKLSSWLAGGSNRVLVLSTSNGIVVISGTVDRFDDLQKINDQLQDVDGIKAVSNQVDVKQK